MNALRFALRNFSEKKYFLVRVYRGLRAAIYAFFTGGGVTANGIHYYNFTHKKTGQKHSGFRPTIEYYSLLPTTLCRMRAVRASSFVSSAGRRSRR